MSFRNYYFLNLTMNIMIPFDVSMIEGVYNGMIEFFKPFLKISSFPIFTNFFNASQHHKCHKEIRSNYCYLNAW